MTLDSQAAIGDRDPPEKPLDPVQSAFVLGVRLLEAGRASLLLRREDEATLRIAAAVGIPPKIIESIEVPIGQGIAGLVADRGMSLLGVISDQTFLSAAVLTRNGVEGVLNMTERLGGRLYTSSDLASTRLVAGHIGLLLDYRRAARIDPISGLPDRQAFDEAAERELRRSEREDRRFTIVLVDLEGLKAVNETYGHGRGDELIRAVASALRQAIRQYDFAARYYSGDEYALILAGPQDTSRVRERVQTAVHTETSREGFWGRRVHIGMATFPEDGRDLSQILTVAETRLRADKADHGSSDDH